jgi:hypothetical protein
LINDLKKQNSSTRILQILVISLFSDTGVFKGKKCLLSTNSLSLTRVQHLEVEMPNPLPVTGCPKGASTAFHSAQCLSMSRWLRSSVVTNNFPLHQLQVRKQGLFCPPAWYFLGLPRI